MAAPAARRRVPRSLAISAAPRADASDPAWLAALAEAGVEGLQIREKHLHDKALADLVRAARGRGFDRGGLLLVNGRLDVALAARADGAHLPADGIPVAALRARFGPDPVLGRSTHCLEEVEAARDAGADYVTFGPVWPTASKPGHPGTGPDALRRAAAIGVPVLALGGVSLERLAEVAAAGASGVAAIGMFTDQARLPEIGARIPELFAEAPTR